MAIDSVAEYLGTPRSHAGNGGDPRRDLIDLLLARDGRGQIHASYDAARDSDEFKNYWANADSLDADSANSKAVRSKLVPRSRYEVGNNGYVDGMVQTHANYLVGTGPALRMKTASEGFNRMVETAWKKWAKAVLLRRKLWTQCHAKVQDGEGIGLIRHNPRIRHPVKLDYVLIETEQCQTPMLPYGVEGYIDGIFFDEFGNPQWYDVLPQHPGGPWAAYNLKPEHVPARFVMHWFMLRRPGQHRGVPEQKSTLNVGASFRRWREATVASAESAAAISVLLHTTLTPNEEADQVGAMSSLEFRKRMMTALPMGWDATQMDAKHPNATFGEFNKAQIGELGRSKNMPFNVSAGDSAGYNFASGKLDHLSWFRDIIVERADAEDLVLDQMFDVWFRLAVEVYGWNWTQEDSPDHGWDWPPLPVADEKARATADDTDLKNGSKAPSEVYSDRGKDYDEAVQRLARDYGVTVDEMKQILLQVNLGTPAAPAPKPTPEPDPDEEAQDDA